MLPEVADRNRFGLQPYRVAHDLANQLRAHVGPHSLVAMAIAEIASGHVWTQPAPIPERVEEHGLPVLRRHDHAVAWRYPLAGTDLALYYWQPATGPLILAHVSDATDNTVPNAEKRARHVPSTPTPEPAAQRLTSPRLRPPAPAPADAAPVPGKEAAETIAAAAAGPRRRDTTSLGIDDQALVDALRRADKPTAVSELRTLLGVSETVGRERVRRVLTDATNRGVIGRSGVRGGVRYFLP